MKTSVLIASILCAALSPLSRSSTSVQASQSKNQTRTVAGDDPVSAKTGTSCPSDIIKSFSGQWNGKGLKISADSTQQQTQTKDEFAAIDCQKFEIKVTYVNDSGTPVRTIDLIASSDPSGDGKFFAIEGTMKEGSSVNKMTGAIRQIQDGTLLLSFSGALGGQLAYFTELMNLTTPATGDTQMVRTVQIFAGSKPGGPYIASRVTIETR